MSPDRAIDCQGGSWHVEGRIEWKGMNLVESVDAERRFRDAAVDEHANMTAAESGDALSDTGGG